MKTALFILTTLLVTLVHAENPWSSTEKKTAQFLKKHPKVSSEKIVFKTVTLPNGNELELDFHLERPKEGNSFPVVFYVHGGGWVSGNKSAFVHQSFTLAEHGIAGVRLEYRLKKHGAQYPEAMSDVMDAIDYVRQHAKELNLDFTKVGLAGGSAGGHLSSIAAQKTPECICYDGYNGLFDAFQRDKSRFGGGNYTGKTPKEKKAASAIYNIKKSPPHTFLYHGTKDNTVVIKQAYRFKEALVKKGGTAEVISYEGAGHAFFNKDPYLTATTKALLAHTQFVFGMTTKQPVLSDYFVDPQ